MLLATATVSIPRPVHALTRDQLWHAMIHRTPIRLGNLTGLLNSIAMEDGGGHSFILTLSCNCVNHTMYYKA